jgi:hypothetical protein
MDWGITGEEWRCEAGAALAAMGLTEVGCHCEERSDEAISPGLLRSARNDG